MADEKKPPASDENPSEEPAGKKAAAEKPVPPEKKAAAEKPVPPEKKAAAKKPVTPEKKAAVKKKKAASAEKSEPKVTDVLSEKEKRAATTIFSKNMSVEEEKKALDEIITGASTAADKKKAIDELKKLHVADDIIKKKTAETPEGVTEVKQKASVAKLAASEKILSQGYVADADMALARLADTFDKSARRWEMVVYPSMFAFILLAGYGFYLIYHLTHDIAVLSHSVTRMATIVSDATPRVTSDMRDMSQDMRVMSGEIRTMSYQMEAMKPMSNNIANMTYTMGNLNRSVYGMQRDMGGLNRTISGGPFGFMKDAMPFSSQTYTNPLPPLPMNAGQPVYIQPVPSPVLNAPQSPTQVTPNGK